MSSLAAEEPELVERIEEPELVERVEDMSLAKEPTQEHVEEAKEIILPPPSPNPFVDTLDDVKDKVINNSTDLLALIGSYEGMVEVGRRATFYAMTYPFTNTDVQDWSWLFTYGRTDGWTEKVSPYYLLTSTPQYCNIPVDRVDTGVLRLGKGLEDLDSTKIKFIAVVQSRNTATAYKLIVSQSRRAMAMDMFIELLNNNSIVFVGAVSRDTAIPVNAPLKTPSIQFERVETVGEASALKAGVVGIVC